ncbi:hypothetical protein NSK_000529 [Nannochloropsis salina CCMP1776]|jgi:hypothetical protein|uniref:Transmembrane protein n=1 Tax=Nannochloropsis salina CCMP1776 TaxID=1027361 RepID=A0A4D9DCP0_9STRA|nr:hypothetical protein NSK_000529 [Nannochloropsis salina CCMP1776]|eukprot:TFJ88177.1 hypothetical protein NSK_000529 [Nannochloropsis salina CCMP1776]
MSRNEYEPIINTSGVSWGIESGMLNNDKLYQKDWDKSCCDSTGARRDDSAHLERARRLTWVVLGPAVILLIAMAGTVAFLSQNRAVSSSPTRRSFPSLGAFGPSGDSKVLPSDESTLVQGGSATSATFASEGEAQTVSEGTPLRHPETSMNASTVLSCLEEMCQPFAEQLGKSWHELANVNLLRCLASSAFNKTMATTCFQSAKPSKLRDDLVACAGCNGCVELRNQTSVDRACAKYNAWAAKHSTETDLTRPEEYEEAAAFAAFGKPRAETPGGGRGSDADSLAADLPTSLKDKFCSQYWCP